MTHQHQCAHGCDECNDSDCKNRRHGVLPACPCLCHVRCFRIAYPDGVDRKIIDELTRISDGGGTIQEARVHSGLSAGQAARLAGVPKARIEAIEATQELDIEEWSKLCLLYDVSAFVTPKPAGDGRPIQQCGECHHVWCEGDPSHHERHCSHKVLTN